MRFPAIDCDTSDSIKVSRVCGFVSCSSAVLAGPGFACKGDDRRGWDGVLPTPSGTSPVGPASAYFGCVAMFPLWLLLF